MSNALVALLLVGYASASSLLRVGVIGTGCIGLEHLRNLNLVDEVAITAIADSHEPSRAAAVECLKEIGADVDSVAVHTEYTELLASPDVDAVVVCTPNDHHIEVVRTAFATGKHCLVEKPLCRMWPTARRRRRSLRPRATPRAAGRASRCSGAAWSTATSRRLRGSSPRPSRE